MGVLLTKDFLRDRRLTFVTFVTFVPSC